MSGNFDICNSFFFFVLYSMLSRTSGDIDNVHAFIVEPTF